MNYNETLTYIMEKLPMFQRIGKQAYRSGLENTLKLDAYFNRPHNKFKTIHVAGTNGKGSVSHMLASVLQEAGYKTGLYTSPHLVDFRERIRINGKMINKPFVTNFINKHRPFFETFDPSFFEISVFMAFEYFDRNNVDVAVIEVGLGGRLDATNIINPVLSVITNIGRDHTEILGETIEAISREKAGIIKENIPVIVGESHPASAPVFMEYSKRNNSPLTFADKVYRIDYSLMSIDDYQVFNVKKGEDIRYTNLKCGLLGNYQRKNAITVLAALDVLCSFFPDINEKSRYQGIRNVTRNTGLQGRWQIIRSNPKVICDTAHNADGLNQVIQQLNNTPFKRLHLILGFVNDKDVDAILKYLPARAVYYFVRLSVPRTMSETELSLRAAGAGIIGKAYIGINDAYDDALRIATKEDLVVITGSNFLVADLLAILGQK